MAISIELIKQLREQTGAGISACKEALEQNNGDMTGFLTRKRFGNRCQTQRTQSIRRCD